MKTIQEVKQANHSNLIKRRAKLKALLSKFATIMNYKDVMTDEEVSLTGELNFHTIKLRVAVNVNNKALREIEVANKRGRRLLDKGKENKNKKINSIVESLKQHAITNEIRT